MTEFVTLDSGERKEYASGMKRDVDAGKPRYDLIDRAFLTRWAGLMARGAEKYGDNNWRLASSREELARFNASGLRHHIQYLEGDRTEDHAVAVAFNLAAAEYVEGRLATHLDNMVATAVPLGSDNMSWYDFGKDRHSFTF